MLRDCLVDCSTSWLPIGDNPPVSTYKPLRVCREGLPISKTQYLICNYSNTTGITIGLRLVSR